MKQCRFESVRFLHFRYEATIWLIRTADLLAALCWLVSVTKCASIRLLSFEELKVFRPTSMPNSLGCFIQSNGKLFKKSHCAMVNKKVNVRSKMAKK